MRPLLASLAAACAASLCACTGLIGDAPRPGLSSTRGPGGLDEIDPAMCVGAAPSVAEAPLLRLTRREYEFTVRDLFDVDAPTGELPLDGRGGGFVANAGDAVGVQAATKYAEVATRVAPTVSLAALAGCTTDDCAADAIEQLGSSMLRRPLAGDERTRLTGLFGTARTDLGLAFEDATRVLVEAMLQAPTFLIRGEEAVTASPAGAIEPLNDWEIASRLSYFLWQTTPDDALLAAAARGELSSAEGVETYAQRMLADPRADRAITDFYWQWLWMRTGAGFKWEADPAIDASLLADYTRETERFVLEVTRNGSFSDLFTASWSFVDARLAEAYGVDGAASITGDELVRADLPANERSGLLTQGLFLVTHNRTERLRATPLGHVVRERVLCEGLPPPPAMVPALNTDPTLSAREVAAMHSASAACGDCHRLMDPIGLAFMSYDATGRFRTTDEAGDPIDASGELLDAGDATGVVNGVVDLSRRLAESDKVLRCYVDSWFAFALARPLAIEDGCSRALALDRFQRSGGRIGELLLGIVTSDAFRYRKTTVPVAEVCL